MGGGKGGEGLHAVEEGISVHEHMRNTINTA